MAFMRGFAGNAGATEAKLEAPAGWVRFFIKNTHATQTLEVRVESGITGEVVAAAGGTKLIEVSPFTVSSSLWLVGSGATTTYTGYFVCA